MRNLVSLLLVMFLVGCGEDEAAQIRASFDEYQSALRAADGPQAIALMSSATIEYFDRLHELAVRGDAAEIQSRRYWDRELIAMARHQVDPKYLKSLTGSQLVMVGVQQGWLNGYIGTGAQIDSIQAQDASASAAITNWGNVKYRYEFVKEGGAWKQHLVPLIDGNSDLNESLGESKQKQDAFILESIKVQSGKAVSPNIWQKPKN
jgi:hypothetical protein